ncbi:MAG: response regulator [Myxococcota bacterium]
MVTYPDGSRAAQLVNAFPLRDSDGAVYGVCGITFDITGRKEAEEQRLALERRFLHAQKLESLGVLAGGVAHDFNNLLLAILGNLDLALGDTEPDSELREDIVNAMHAARRAADLAHQMLAFSGKGSFVLTQIDFRRVIQDSADLLRASLSKRIDLDITLADELPLVEADLGQIQQLMLNLIANASDAIGGDAGKVTIQVGSEVLDEATLAANRVSTEVKPGRYVVLGITDTGCGMNRETLDKLFDPFFSTKGPGRGMGMAALLGIVRAHQGAVLVQSGPGAGTRIRIAFQPSEPLRSTSAPPSSSAGAASSRSRPGYVLVVDDEDVVRRVCSRFVERLGFPTLSASDGEEAVEVFRKRHKELSCVILDMSMPRLGGVGALQKMKTIDATVPVILSSGYSEDQLAEVAAKGDLAGFITKPYDMDAFSRVLKEAVKQGTRSS